MLITSAPILLSRIKIDRKNRRLVDSEKVKQIVASFNEVGLLQPIMVREFKDGFKLVIGAHRFDAAKSLKWPSIDARIISDKISDSTAEIMEIDENICRKNLTKMEEGAAHVRRKMLWEAEHPETKKGAAGGAATKAKAKGQIAPKPSKPKADPYYKETAKVVGVSAGTIKRRVALGTEARNDDWSQRNIAGASFAQIAKEDNVVTDSKTTAASYVKNAVCKWRVKHEKTKTAELDVKETKVENKSARIDTDKIVEMSGEEVARKLNSSLTPANAAFLRTLWKFNRVGLIEWFDGD